MACHSQPPFLHFSLLLASATEIRKPKHSTCRVLNYHSSWNSMHEFGFIDYFFLIQNWVTWREDYEHLFGIWIQRGAREEFWASLVLAWVSAQLAQSGSECWGGVFWSTCFLVVVDALNSWLALASCRRRRPLNSAAVWLRTRQQLPRWPSSVVASWVRLKSFQPSPVV